MDTVQLADLLGPLGLVVFLLVVVVWGGRKKWWTFGWVLDNEVQRRQEVELEKEYWKNIAVRSLNIGEDAVRAAVKVSPEHSLIEMARVVDQARVDGRLP